MLFWLFDVFILIKLMFEYKLSNILYVFFWTGNHQNHHQKLYITEQNNVFFLHFVFDRITQFNYLYFGCSQLNVDGFS